MSSIVFICYLDMNFILTLTYISRTRLAWYQIWVGQFFYIFIWFGYSYHLLSFLWMNIVSWSFRQASAYSRSIVVVLVNTGCRVSCWATTIPITKSCHMQHFFVQYFPGICWISLFPLQKNSQKVFNTCFFSFWTSMLLLKILMVEVTSLGCICWV